MVLKLNTRSCTVGPRQLEIISEPSTNLCDVCDLVTVGAYGREYTSVGASTGLCGCHVRFLMGDLLSVCKGEGV